MRAPPWVYDPVAEQSEFGDTDELIEILREQIGNREPEWAVEEQEIWLVVAPAGRPRRGQGWKLHVAATILSAAAVLSRVLPILVERRCHFKFAKSLRQLQILNSAAWPEGMSGKFVTVYPADDDEAVVLARACHEATLELDGPRILSDRVYLPGSLIHYRYGSFARDRIRWTFLDKIEPAIECPDGSLVADKRLGWYTPPDWASDPFKEPIVALGAKGAPPDQVMLGRYRVTRALKRSNRGGTYRGRVADNDVEVVIKEARPHVATDRFGRDARDRLRHEFTVLEALAPAMIAPEPLELFEHGGHLFLAEEDLRGPSLRSFVQRRYADRGVLPTDEDLRSLGGALAQLIKRCHGAGFVVRDFNPNNIVLARGTEPKLVDLELAHRMSEPLATPFRGATSAYASPQQVQNLPPTFADDVFSFGSTLYFLATTTDPFFLPDAALGRSRREKTAEQLMLSRAPDWTTDLILRCQESDPSQRPSADELVALGNSPRMGRRSQPPIRSAVPSLAVDQIEAVVDQVVVYLAAARADKAGQRCWPTTGFGQATDPLNITNGSSGVGLFLCQLARDRPSVRVTDLLAATAGATVAALRDSAPRPNGLYFGQAGVAWFLAETAAVLEETALGEQACALLAGLPPVGEVASVVYGTAGLCQAAIRLWLATGDSTMRERVEIAASHLVEAITPTPFGPGWVIPASHTPEAREKVYPGYAYGTAGIAYTLLCAARITGRAAYMETATEALDGLLASIIERDGQRWWPTSTGKTSGSPCWLKGASGIGSALIRAHLLSGRPTYREGALGCVAMVLPPPYGAPLTQVHGLAGVGEFLLDAVALLGAEELRTAVGELAAIIYTRRVDRRHDGLGIFFPDEDGLGGADFGTGVTGIASFLHRLAQGSPRPLMLDGLLRAEPA